VRNGSYSRKLLGGNSFDCFDSYGLKSVAIQVLLQRTKHPFEELVEWSIVHVEVPASRYVHRDLTSHDAATKGAEGETKMFS
jgi:hypothetical protein